MKNFPFLALLLFIGFCSCTTSDGPTDSVKSVVVEVEDVYNYIVMRHDGQLFEIGDNTGKITAINKIPNIEFISTINAVSGSPTNLYIYEHNFPPSQPLIHEYNFASKTTKSYNIAFSEEVFGTHAGLVSLEWNEENKVLVAMVKENYGVDYPLTSRIAQIDPVTFNVTSLKIEVDRGHIMGTLIRGETMYASSYKSSTTGVHDFFKIDLQSGLISSLEVDGMTIAPIHLSYDPAKNSLFGFLPVQGSTFMGASKPVVIVPATGVVKHLLPNELTGNYHQFGRSFFNSEAKEHVDFITSATYNALFRYNSNTQQVTVTKLPHPNDMGTSISIVGVKKV